MIRTGQITPLPSRSYRHTLPVRILHWIIAVSLPIMLMSGLNIFNAHPALYWGTSSAPHARPLLVISARQKASGELVGITTLCGHSFTTTGLLGVSRHGAAEGEEARGFPAWLTLPDTQWLAMARRWHLFFAWLLTTACVSFIGYTLLSGHASLDLLPTRHDWRELGPVIRDHLLFRSPTGEAATRYNILQKLAYVSVIFLLLPLVIINGLGMSPALDALGPGWVDLFGGRQSMRTIHFAVSWLLVGFTGIHLFQVVITGFRNNLRSMLTGFYRIPPEKNHGRTKPYHTP